MLNPHIHSVYIVSFLFLPYIGLTVLQLLPNSSATEFQQLKLVLVCGMRGRPKMIRGVKFSKQISFWGNLVAVLVLGGLLKWGGGGGKFGITEHFYSTTKI